MFANPSLRIPGGVLDWVDPVPVGIISAIPESE
jgi:hypothetical protein